MTNGRTPVLYLAPWVDLGGADKGTIDWFRHVDRESWAPSLITTQPSPNRWLGHVDPLAEEVWELPDLMAGGSFPEFILGFIESRGVRVVHLMNSRLGFDLLPDIACLPDPPAVVVQLHAEEPNGAGFVSHVTRRYGNLVDAFSVTSEHLKEVIAGYEIPPSRIEVIHSGVDAEWEFNPDLVEPLALGDDDGLARILWPGRLVEQKDPMLTLEVLARLRELDAEFLLDVVGDGPMKEGLLDRARSLDVADSIRWHPPSQEMARWYRSADLMLMTSVFEGVPYVIYEALAMGVPVVAPALPGNVELMDADSGVLVDPRDDPELYAAAIAGLLADEGRRAQLGIRSRERMRADFSLAEMGRRHDELYERLLGSRPYLDRSRIEVLPESNSGGDTPAAPAITLPRDAPPERSVGVVVPCYRHGIYIDECVESIKAQTLKPAQIVIVDDGSDDPETIEALSRLERDPDLTVLRQEANSGPSAARNRGLRQLETSYALPLDADDKLLPEALEQMVARLEGADEDIGYVYPHPQYFGNRSDYVLLPAYNLWLLMEENFIPAACLFDRRVFGSGGVAYPEDLVVGHEDWDLLLQLAERDVRGLHADGPTFLYRRHGFTRINTVEYGPDPSREEIERRHPSLYGERDAIKARCAPALSIVLHDEDGQSWADAELPSLARQTCCDFEVLARVPLTDGVRPIGDPGASPGAWLQEAIREGLGRWLCILTPPARPLLRAPAFVEQLLYGFAAGRQPTAIAMASFPAAERHAFSQLDDGDRLQTTPSGIAFERPYASLLPEVELDGGRSPVVDLVMSIQVREGVQWRVVPSVDDLPLRENPADEGERLEVLDPNLDRTGDRPAGVMRDGVARQSPRLPGLTTGTVRRWDRSEPWTPPETQLLHRHAGREGDCRLVSNDPDPPPGYAHEFTLGAVRVHEAPATRRLVRAGDEYESTDNQNELGEDQVGLGYLELQPLPMLEALEVRTMPETGRKVLVAGREDPLNLVAKPLGVLGWLEACPILPRGELLQPGPWGLVALVRQTNGGRRHRYATGAPTGPGATRLGFLRSEPGREFVALRRLADGRLVSELAEPGTAERDPREALRWAAGPLKGARGGSPRAAVREAGDRLRHVVHERRGTRGPDGDGEATLGWLRRTMAPGWGPLYSATHPATGDQLAARSTTEAECAGYRVDGVLGYLLTTFAGHGA